MMRLFVFSFICNLLRAARRAMAATCRCPRRQQQIFSPPIQDRSSCLNHCGPYWGNPISYYPGTAEQRKGKSEAKEKEQKKEKREMQSRAGPARPPRLLNPGPPLRPCLHPALPSQTTPYSPPSCPPGTLELLWWPPPSTTTSPMVPLSSATCSPSQSSSIFHNPLIWGAHARHSVNK